MVTYCIAKMITTSCWFSVSRHSKQIIIKNQNRSIDQVQIWKQKEGRYAKTLTKIQVTAIFLMGDIRRNVFPNLQRFVWKRHVGAQLDGHLDRHQHGGLKPAETSVTEFCYKSVNLSLEELKNVTITLQSNTRAVQIAEFPEISHFFNQHHSSLARHVNATSRKSLEIQAQSITKPRTHSE